MVTSPRDNVWQHCGWATQVLQGVEPDTPKVQWTSIELPLTKSSSSQEHCSCTIIHLPGTHMLLLYALKPQKLFWVRERHALSQFWISLLSSSIFFPSTLSPRDGDQSRSLVWAGHNCPSDAGLPHFHCVGTYLPDLLLGYLSEDKWPEIEF